MWRTVGDSNDIKSFFYFQQLKINTILVNQIGPTYKPTFELRGDSKTDSVLTTIVLALADQYNYLCGAYSPNFGTISAEGMLCLAVTTHSTEYV